MRILLIGGNGFIGKAIGRYFLEKGHSVSSISRGKSTPIDGVEPIIADRKNADAFKAAIGKRSFDLAVDLTAFNPPDVDAVVPTLKGNVGHYVMISTDFVYSADIEQFPIAEDAQKDTHTPYGIGKLAAERRLAELHRTDGFPYTVLRPPHVIGAGRELGTGSVQGRDWNLLKSLRAGTGLTLIAEGTLLVQPVWHRQIAEAIEAVNGKTATVGALFNICDEQAITIRRYYEMICDLIGVPLRFDSISLQDFLTKNPHSPIGRHRCYQVEKLTGMTGMHPGRRIEDALHESVKWLSAHPAID
jgi:nucleoside-diphosphate-sugar epimerase